MYLEKVASIDGRSHKILATNLVMIYITNSKIKIKVIDRLHFLKRSIHIPRIKQEGKLSSPNPNGESFTEIGKIKLSKRGPYEWASLRITNIEDVEDI